MTLFDSMHHHPYVSIVMLLIVIDGLRSSGESIIGFALDWRETHGPDPIAPDPYRNPPESFHEFGCKPPLPVRPLIWFKPYAQNRGSERVKSRVQPASPANDD